MAIWLQHLLVLTLVGGCLAFVAVQGVRTLRGRKSKLGACCAKGCGAGEAEKPANSGRIVFLPSEMLTSSKRSQRH